MQAAGLGTPDALKRLWDFNPGFGGPIKRDRLWFFGNARTFGSTSDVPGLYSNGNAGNANAFTYVEDRSLKARNANSKLIGAMRLTGQLTPRNKLGFYYDYQKNCSGGAYTEGAEQCRDPRPWTHADSVQAEADDRPRLAEHRHEIGDAADCREVRHVEGGGRAEGAHGSSEKLAHAMLSLFVNAYRESGGELPEPAASAIE